MLCRRHHRFVHEGGYTIDEHGRFHHRHGWEIPPVPPQPPGSLATLEDANRGLELTPKTCATGRGDPMNMSLTVAALLRIVGRPEQPAPGSGQEEQTRDMRGPHGCEVPMVERREPVFVEHLERGDHRGVDEPEREVAILLE